MNLVLTRTKNEHLSFWWEPFATSTPLKAIPNNVTNKNKSQKQWPVHSNSNDFLASLHKKSSISHCFQKDQSIELKHSVFKRKKKSLAYFDLSSSDEDSSFECKKRPIIKLDSGKRTKSVLITKKQTDGKIGLKRKGSKNKEVNCELVGNINTEEGEKNTGNTKSAKSERIYHQNLTDTGALNPNSDFKINGVSKDEESKIFDETNKAKDSGKSTLRFKSKESTVNNLKNNDNLKELSAFNEIGMSILTETLTTNQVSAKLFHKNIRDFQNLKDTQKGASETNDLLHKIKGNDFEKRIDFVTESRTKKVRSKLAEQPFNMVFECAKNSQCNHESKANVTHQLFSDTKEQEFMNTLDLTADELDETGENKRCSMCIKENNVSDKLIFISHSSNHKSLSHTETKQVKIKRRKPNSKKLFTLERPLKELVPNVHEKKQNKKEKNVKANDNYKTQECQLSAKSKKLDLFVEKVNEENGKKNNINNQKAQKKGKRKIVNVVGKNKTTSATNDPVNFNTNEKVKAAEKNVTLSSTGSITEFNKNSELNKPLLTSEDENEINREKPVFKLLNELSYEENIMGCSVVQCWNIGTFKCGVFKLKAKSVVTCKTLHSNSHLGGVLVKGNLRMKIANRELDLKEGDTAFVPPLTEWQATNIGDCESIFYYWCGRFNI